jgi:hypothetical protein
MNVERIVEFLIKNHYGCVRFGSNKNLLREIIPSVSGEGGVCVLTEEKNLTEEYLSEIQSPRLTIMTPVEYLSEKIEVSLLYIGNIQKVDTFTLAIIDGWYKKYKDGEEKLPYLLLSSISSTHQDLPLPLKNHHLQLEKEPKVEIDFEDNEDNFVEMIRDSSSQKIVVILSSREKIDSLKEEFSDLCDRLVSVWTPKKRWNSKKREIILTLDYSLLGFYIDDVDEVFDFGKDNMSRAEMKIRAHAFSPKRYIINKSKSTIRKVILHQSSISGELLFLIHSQITDFSFIENLSLLERSLKDIQLLNLVNIPRLTEKGGFCMALALEGLDIFHGSLLYYAIKNNISVYPIIVLVALFQEPPCSSSDGGSFEDDYMKISQNPTPFSEKIRSLFGEEKKIFNPRLSWKEIRPHLEKLYPLRIMKYDAGYYHDGEGNKYKLGTKRDVSRLILAVKFKLGLIDYHVPLVDET